MITEWRRLFRILLVFAWSLLLTDCGRSASESRLNDSEPAIQDVLIFFSSGFGSCGDERFPSRITPLVHEMRQYGVQLRYVAACFDTSATLHFSSSALQGERMKTGDYNAVIRYAASELAQVQSKSVYFIGHSYGGWLSMTVAENLAGRSRVRGIVTIDPMSPNHCYTSVVAKSYLQQGIGLEGEPGCLQAPLDWGPSRRTNLHQRSGWWLNFYQATDRLIHSGPMPPAENFLIPYDESRSYNALAHRDIDTDARVWKRIEDRILTEL
jgi:pimeloyl-ACP methyl ester carboxylesterase